MDLNLRGSQINLVVRPKEKPNPRPPRRSNQQKAATTSHARPHSATFLAKRTPSPFLCRPQSADPRFRRKIDNNCGHCSISDKQRCQTVPSSSSDLLQLLLDEPIKRPWLFRGSPAEGASSPEEFPAESAQKRCSPSTSNLSTSNLSKCKNRGADQYQRERTRVNVTHHTTPSAGRRIESTSTTFKMSRDSEKPASGSSSGKTPSSDYWQSSTYSSLCNAAKTDLPGRVSFSNANKVTKDEDSSDCDNDKETKMAQQINCASDHQHHNDDDDDGGGKEGLAISTPAPMTLLTPLESTAMKNSAATASEMASGSKKTVRFGANGGKEVLAETYEYPKCPSENCTCSTGSSSTASLLDAGALNAGCICAVSPAFSMDVNNSKTLDNALDILINETVKSSSAFSYEETPSATLAYGIVGDGEVTVKKTLIEKNITQESKPKTVALNNMELATNYIESKTQLEPQNNLSDILNNKIKNQILYKRACNENQVKDLQLLKSENNFEEIKLIKTGTTTTTTTTNRTTTTASATTATATATTKAFESEEFINNYLQNMAAKSKIVRKKQENKTNCVDNSKGMKTKSFEAVKMGRVVKERNLSEFNIDKIDTWMSIHEPPNAESRAEREIPAESKTKLKQLMKDWDDGGDDDGGDDDGGDDDDGDKDADTASEVSMKSNNSSQDDTTYDEIVSIIKEIEEDKKKENFAQPKIQEAAIDELKRDEVALQTEKGSSECEKSPDKYRDILNYLDDVEDSCDKTLLETRRSIPESNRSEIEFVVEPDIAEDVPKLSELLMLPNHQLARRVMALSLRANELANAVYLSKEHVMKIRSEKQKSVRSEKANAAARLRDQKKHYETIVTRHQGFIEQLLKDKGSLCEKVAALTRRLESQNQAWEHRLATEVQRVKETTLAGEKIRRERWVRENTKRIKELTVKGLEMEINKMTCSHQREVTELKSIHQQQLLDALEEARLKHEKIESTIRETCAQERESVIEKERAALRERFKHQLEEEKKLFDEQKQKLCEDFATERERLQAELKDKENEYQIKRQEIQREKEQELEEAVAELQEKLSKQDEKYQNRIKNVEKQYEADYEIWKRDYESSLKVQQVEKENMIRQHYRTERDRQIDVIVSRMDSEALKNAEEFEMKINRLKEKHEKDLLAAETVEKSLREKYTDARNRLAESDAQVRNQQAEMKQLQIELQHSKKMCSEFLTEREQLRQNLRNEVQNEVVSLKSEHDNDIQKIHKRVQQAIEKKDATIELLRGENGTLRERCIKLEAIIRQQRKDYCAK